ncbi:MAG TPA: TetR/AcrR family transcriptional regulator [Caulobacteraceae bacterium]
MVRNLAVREVAVAQGGRNEARRRAIIEVAREAFLAQGYAATSMSEIAARLGGSKGTLYNYFRSKEELFAAFMVDTCEGSANAFFEELPPIGGDLRAALITLGSGLLGFLLKEEIMAVHRLVVAEAGRFPELGAVFYQSGPRRGEMRFEAYFREVMDAHQLRRGDPLIAGRWFRDLVLSDIYTRRLWGVREDLTPAKIRAHCTEAVDIFLAAFGPLAP